MMDTGGPKEFEAETDLIKDGYLGHNSNTFNFRNQTLLK